MYEPDNDPHRYDDIIDLPRPVSAAHRPMPRADRAAQFSPFAALTGHGAAISETARLTDRQIELSEDAKALLDQKQSLLTERLAEHPEVAVTWFRADSQKEGGRYEVAQGRLRKIDAYARCLVLEDGSEISLHPEGGAHIYEPSHPHAGENYASYGADGPILLDQVAAVRFGDLTIPWEPET